jgi:CDP-6-deoxy-D-xylo-4-hexulose-3-dehydrase
MGEGGAVFTNDIKLKRLIESFRDWGRDCYCAPGNDNTCGKRFGWQFGNLPAGYDHKYTYTHAGFNLKITDMQAALGLSQLRRIDEFVLQRRINFARLSELLSPLSKQLVLPQATPESQPSWFGFPITLSAEANFQRVDLLRYLDQHKIGTRLLFAGNLTRQPYFAEREFRISGNLRGADRIMNDTFWLGTYPGLGEAQLEYIATKLLGFFGHGI